MDTREKELLRGVYRRVAVGDERLTTAAVISRETGIPQQSLYTFNFKGYLSDKRCETLRQFFTAKGWMRDHAGEEKPAPYGRPAGVVRVGELGDPEAVLIGGLQNALVLARDRSVPLRARLVHLRQHLQFLMDNFLGEASLPAGPEDG